MCTKRCLSKPEAIQELEKCVAKRLRGDPRRRERRMYWCRTCQWWHLTSHTPRKAER